MARKGKIEIGASVTVGAKEDGSLSAIEKRIEKLSNEEIEINIKDASKHLKELEKMGKALGKNMAGAIEAQRKQFEGLIEKCKEEQKLRAESLKQVKKQVEASKELQKIEEKKSKPQEKKTGELTKREQELASITKGLKGIRGMTNAFENPSIQKTEEQVQKLIDKLDEYQTKLEAMKRLRKGNERTMFDTAKSEINDLRRALSAIQTVKDRTPSMKPKLEKKEKEVEQEKPKQTTTPTPAPAKDPTAEGIQKQADATKEQARNLAQVNAELEKEKEKLAEIERAQTRNDAAREALQRKRANYSGEALQSDKAIYDTDKVAAAIEGLRTFNSELEKRNQFMEKYKQLYRIVQGSFVGQYSISNGIYTDMDQFISGNPMMKELDDLARVGIKGIPTKRINGLFAGVANGLRRDVSETQRMISSGAVLGAKVNSELDQEEIRLGQEQQRLYDERETQLTRINALQREQLELMVQKGREEKKNTQTQNIGMASDPEELETLRQENSTLEKKLELLQEIANQYGSSITKAKRDRYEALNQKEAESGLTRAEEDRYYELGDIIREADEALDQFGAAYDQIILKLENGRKVSILPDDEGLRKLSKFIDEGWGETYNGFDIVDITFERVKAIEEVSGAVETEVKVADENVRSNEKIIASYDELISKLNEFIQLKQKVVDIYNAGGDIKPHNDKLRELEADLVRGMDSSNASSAEMMLQSFPMGIDQKALTGSLAVFLGIEIPIESATEAIQEETKAIEANTQATEKNIKAKKKLAEQQSAETNTEAIQEETKAIKSWTGEAVRHLDILNLKARTLKKELKDIKDYVLEEQKEMGSVFNSDTGASIEIVYKDGGSTLLMDGEATRWDASGQKILDHQQIGSYTETTTDEQTGKEITRRIRGMTKKAVEDLFKNVVYAIYSDGYCEFDTQIGDLAPYHIDASEGRLWSTNMDYVDIYKSRVKALHGDLMDLEYQQKTITTGEYDKDTKLIQQYESLIDNVELMNRLYSEQADILDKIEAKESELAVIRANREGLDDKIRFWESDKNELLWREALLESFTEEEKTIRELVSLRQQYDNIQLPSKEKTDFDEYSRRNSFNSLNIEQAQSNVDFQKRERDKIKLAINTKTHASEIKSLEQINSELESINQQYEELRNKLYSYQYDSPERKAIDRVLQPLSIQRGILLDRKNELLKEAQLDAQTTPSGPIGMFKGMADPIIAATEETQKLGEAMEEVQRIAGQVSFFGDTVAQEVAQSIASATAETTSTAAGQLAQGIQQIGDTAQQTAQQLRQQAAATEILTSSSEQATQQVEQQATITERSATPSQTPNVLPALTVPERIATIGNGAIDNLLKDYNITNPEAQSEVVNAFDEMARIIKAVFDKAKVEGPVSNKDNLFARLQESADKASSLIIQLGTEAHDTSESLDGLRDFYSFMKGKKIRYNNSIKAEYGDEWGKFYNRFKNYLTPSPTAETAGSLYKHLSGEASDGTGLPNANIDGFRQFFPQDLGDDIHQFARIFEVLGNALDASNGGRSWKKIDKIPLRNTSNESKQDIRGQVQDIQIGMIQTLKQMTDASAEALRNEEQLVEGERAVGDAVRNTNEARREGNEEQRKAIQDVGDASENERQSIIERDEARALEVLRKAKDNKTNLVDLSGVYSTDDLKGQLESMASTITGKEGLLSVGNVHIQDNIASVTMYNEALGITYKQLYEVSKAAEDAEESQLKLWSESYDENYKAAQKYSEAQKKKIAKDDSWLIAQASKLNTQERKYKYSSKKVEGTTALTDADETSLAEGADRTIDSLTAHIKNKIQSAMGQGLTNEVRNEIINDLRILDNEIKIEQYKKYASTTMKPSELKSAKDELEYTLQSLEAKAKKNNVFSQIEQDVISLRSQLKGVADGTQLSKFIDDLRVTKSKLNAEIAKEQTTKKEEQNYQNLINLQNRLYEAKRKLNDLEIKGQSDTAEGQQASRKVQELQDQYDLSVKLLQNEEHRRAIEDRGTDLDSQLNTAKDQKQIEQYYQNIFDTVQRINNLDSQINTFKMKDGGKGIYSDLIASLESEKATLLGKINQIGADVNQYFNGVFASVGDVEKVQLPFNSLLKDTSAYSTILDFLNSVDVRATLGAEAVNKLVQAFYNSSQAGSEFVGKISAQFKPAEEAFARLQQIISSGGLNVDNDGTYQQMKQRFDMLQQLSQTDMSKWSAEEIAYFTNLAKSVAEYADSLSKAAEQEANYFAGKTKAYAGDTMHGNPQKNELMVVDQPDKNIDTARQALERYVAAFTEGRGIITGFTTAANGISQITFSALDEGTGQFRTFTAEMGRCTDNIYRTETTLNSLTSGTNAAKKSIASLVTVMSQLNGVSGAEEQLKALWEVYQNLQNAINNKGNSQNVGDQNMFKNMATDADKARKEVEKLIKEWAKAQAGLDDGSLTPLGSIDKNGNIKEQMWENIKTSTDGARASFVDFDEKTNTLTYTLTNADKTVTTMTAHMYGLNGAVVAQAGKTEELKTGWQDLTGALNGALKGVGQYLGRAFSMWAIVGQLKQGFNAVKQIDAALTELKKVTDETEGSYQRFLNTASQTAGKIGSTVSDFTEATANFARLGYTMEESAKMAEAAIVYKNVADGLDSVEESTESIISTMKAFGIESDNTMSIIDKFNEVGNNFSITSAGIGEALQRSASALYEANNSIDESIALVTAANSVIQNPEQVGEMLADYKVA